MAAIDVVSAAESPRGSRPERRARALRCLGGDVLGGRPVRRSESEIAGWWLVPASHRQLPTTAVLVARNQTLSLKKNMEPGTSLVLQWLGLRPANTGGIGLVSAQGTNTGNLWCGKKKKSLKKMDPILRSRPYL